MLSRLVRRPRALAPAFLVLVVGAAAGCSEKTTEQAAATASAEPAKPKTVLGGRLGAAVAAAESGARPGASGAPSGDLPPESGVYAGQAADKLIAVGAAPKIDFGSDGNAPRIELRYAPSAEEQKISATIAIRLAQSAMPTVDFQLAARREGGASDGKDAKEGKDAKGKGKNAKGKEKGKEKDATRELLPEVAPGNVRVVVRILDATPAKDQPGRMPKEVGDAIAKLKGGALVYELSPDGAVVHTATAIPKDADPALEQILGSLGEAVLIWTIPLPKKPVGVGAFWMATDRAASFGIDVVRCRMFKVEKLAGERPVLSVVTRQYAAKAQAEIGAKGSPLGIDKFESKGKGTIDFGGGALPASADLTQQLVAVLGGATPAGAQPGQRMVLQTELTAKIR